MFEIVPHYNQVYCASFFIELFIISWMWLAYFSLTFISTDVTVSVRGSEKFCAEKKRKKDARKTIHSEFIALLFARQASWINLQDDFFYSLHSTLLLPFNLYTTVLRKISDWTESGTIFTSHTEVASNYSLLSIEFVDRCEWFKLFLRLWSKQPFTWLNWAAY